MLHCKDMTPVFVRKAPAFFLSTFSGGVNEEEDELVGHLNLAIRHTLEFQRMLALHKSTVFRGPASSVIADSFR